MLTKSDFTKHEECPIWLWLVKMRPDLLPPESPELTRLFAQGNEVELLARKSFPGGVQVRGFNRKGWDSTQELMLKGAKILFQPTAISPDDLTARADILTKVKDDVWDLNEVKMTSSVKEEHIPDVAFQKICFENAGIKIGRTFLIHLNIKYIKKGEIEPNKLFVKEDITDDVNFVLSETKMQIEEAKKVIAGTETIDELLIQKCTNPERCDYLEFYIHGFPEVYSIADKIPGKHLKAMLERRLLDPDKLSPDLIKRIGFTPEVPFKEINAEGIRNKLGTLKYPLYFLDYETYGPAIPVFDNTGPYQPVPFQYSLHIRKTVNSPLEHKEFLARSFVDPVPELLAQLRNDIGSNGSVLVWYKNFEMTRNSEMAAQHPEYAKFLNNLNNRIFDLMLIFKFDRKLYMQSEFHKSASLKKVLPVICPELSYGSLEIREGETASASWPILTNPDTPKPEKEKLAEDMLKYCKRDTMAMVGILDHLEKEIKI